MGTGEGRVEIDGLLKKTLSDIVIVWGSFAQMPQAALVRGPDVEALGGLAHCASSFSVVDGRGDGDSHCVCDLVLHRKNIREVAVVVLGPGVLAALSLDQLRGRPYP